MAKRHKGSRRARAKKALHHVRRHAGKAMGSRPGQIVVGALEMAAGGVVSSMAVNKLPMISTQSKTVKILAQAGIGAALVFFVRNRHVKSAGAGAVIAAAMGAAKNFLNLEPLAGPSIGSRTLNPTELQRIASGQMSMPSPVQMKMPSPVQMNGGAGFRRPGF